jgi:hypothetical protein
MSNGGGSKRNRGGGGGGGGGNQQRRRRSGGGGQGGGGNRPQAPNGPAMTALGESTYEAVFDHGGSGYGVWFDGVVREDPMYKQFWKGTGTRPLFVRIEEDRIVLLKQLDRELPPVAAPTDGGGSATPDGLTDADVDAAIEEAVAEAMAAAGAAAGGTEETVYSPEEAAALFAAEGGAAPAAEEAPAAAAPEAEPEAAAKPKKRVTRKKAAPKTDED